MAKAQTAAQALRQKLITQQRELGNNKIINNKKVTKIRLRVLPMNQDLPGKDYFGLYSPALNKGTTSPRTFGLRCPVLDAFEELWGDADKKEKEALKAQLNRQREYWMGVFPRSDMGTADAPNMQVFRGKRTVYEQIVNYMLTVVDEDTVEDITDSVMGRDMLVTKEGSGMDTEWKVKMLDRQPIVEDEEDLKGYVEAAKEFDVADYFYKVDLEVLEEIYVALTGGTIPDEYLEELKGVCKTAEGEEEESSEAGEADPEAPEGIDGEAEVVEVVFGETIGVFMNDKDEVAGIITGEGPDDEGDDCFLITEEGDEDPWYVPKGSVTIPEPEPEEEPVEAAPTVGKKAPRKPAAKTVAKKAAKKTGGKTATTATAKGMRSKLKKLK